MEGDVKVEIMKRERKRKTSSFMTSLYTSLAKILYIPHKTIRIYIMAHGVITSHQGVPIPTP